MRGKLLVRGSINIDEFFEVNHIVRSGETISSTGFSRRAGGKGANQAVAAAKAGATVDFTGLIGSDGAWLRDTLEGYGVGLSLLGTDEDLPTGRAIIQLSTTTADNSIVLLPGANFSPSQSTALPPPSDLSSYTHLLLQNEIPLSDTKTALRTAKEAGVVTVFNPSPMLKREELEAFGWEMLDWLLINEGEGEDLLFALSPSPTEAQPAAKEEKASAEELLRRLRKTRLEGLQGIIMTRGAEGVCASLKGGETVNVGAGKVEGKVVDTTGAGDCFTGFFATLLSTLSVSSSSPARDASPVQAILSTSCQAAAICCETHGAMESVPDLATVKARMGSSWARGPWDELLK
ncbi:hypothetical protein JCM11641_001231 [Rhodosporidiobolus odoratus]